MKHYTILFDKPVVLPGDNLEKITAYGMYLQESIYKTPDNIRNYLWNYILVLAEVFKDKKVMFHGTEYFEKNGDRFTVDSPMWYQYAEKVKYPNLPFCIVDENLDIKEEDHHQILLTSKGKWKELKSRKDLEWWG